MRLQHSMRLYALYIRRPIRREYGNFFIITHYVNNKQRNKSEVRMNIVSITRQRE